MVSRSTNYANGFGGVIVGQPMGIQKVFHFLGVDEQSGDYLFADKDDKPTTNPNNRFDRTQLVSAFP